MFAKIFYTSCVVGLVCGLLLTAMQSVSVIPIIQEAETYESQGSAATVAQPHAQTHSHDSDAWAPDDGIERTIWTSVSNVATSIGFALLLLGLFSWRNKAGFKHGLLWGAVGFAVFFGSPSLGLAPEIPGTFAADLENRQIWWLATVVATAIGLGLALLAPKPGLKILGAGLLLVPHLVGAPHPDVAGGLAPQALSEQFVWTATITNAVYWLLLGVCSAIAFDRFLRVTSTDSQTTV